MGNYKIVSCALAFRDCEGSEIELISHIKTV